MKTKIISVFLLNMMLFSMTDYVYAQSKNNAISFNGSSTSYVDFGDINALDGTSQFTFESWVFIKSWNDWGNIFSKGQDSDNRIDMQLGQSSNKRLYIHVANGGNAFFAVDNALNVGQWHHLSVTYNGSLTANYSQIKVYIDGVLKTISTSSSSSTSVATSTPSTSASFRIGENFDGRIDDVRIWNTALSFDANLLRYYKIPVNEFHPNYSNLIHYWRADNTSMSNVVIDTKGSTNGAINGATTSYVTVTDNDVFFYRISLGYVIKGTLYNGTTKANALKQANHILYIDNIRPFGDGTIFLKTPTNDGTLSSASYLASFGSRSGVLDFSGSGTSMNCGRDLLRVEDGSQNYGVNQYTYESWVYIDTWQAWSNVFKKESTASERFILQLGESQNKRLYFNVSNSSNAYGYLDNEINIGGWYHIAMVYDGSQATPNNRLQVWINGSKKTLTYNGVLPARGANIRKDFIIGENFDGKLDEMRVWHSKLTESTIQTWKDKSLDSTHPDWGSLQAYWPVDNMATAAKDHRGWKTDLEFMRTSTNNNSDHKMLISVGGPNWRSMINNSANRAQFATNIFNFMKDNGWDGLDFDLEWPNGSSEWSNYSSLIVDIRNKITTDGGNYILAGSVHACCNSFNQAAKNAMDFVGIQSYDNGGEHATPTQFTSVYNAMISAGYARNKIVMGVPYYGKNTSSPSLFHDYNQIIAAYPNLQIGVHTVQIDGRAVYFNDVTIIKDKAWEIVDQKLKGVFWWHFAADIDYSNSMSLLRAQGKVIAPNVNLNGSGSSSRIANFKKLDIETNIEKESLSDLVIYPNPVSSVMKIKYSAKSDHSGNIIIRNLLGQQVIQHRVLLNQGKNTLEFNIPNIKQGVYLLEFLIDDYQKLVKRIVVK